MKTFIKEQITLLILIAISTIGWAQSDSTKEVKRFNLDNLQVIINETIADSDSSTIDKGNSCLSGKNKEENKRFTTSTFILDFGLNTWLSDGSLDMPVGFENMELDRAKSVNFHLGAVQQAINFYGGKLRFIYGLGIEFNNYRFTEDIDLIKKSKPLTWVVNDDVTYKKNKLTTQYLTAPVMLHFNTNPRDEDHNFHIGLGAQFGYLIRSSQKQKWGSGKNKNKRKTVGDFQVNNQRMGYVVQIGYGSAIFYGKYYPTLAFNKNGPQVNTASIGFVVSPF